MPYDLDAVRDQLPILRDWTYLNTGTVGLMAEPVLGKHLDYIADHERGGHATQAFAIDGYERARRAVAGLVGADPADIALNRNATDGVNAVAAHFPLRDGDEVVTSTEEHPAMVLPWAYACQRAGARLRFVPLSHEPDVLGANLRRVVNGRTRVIAMSHVSCETGARIPVQIIRNVVGPTVTVVVDAAQSVGQLPVSIPSLNADFVIGNGHKWLAGPKGSGFAWFAPSAIELAPPAYIGDGSVNPRWSRSHYQVDDIPPIEWSPGALRHEFGTRAWHTYGALADAIEWQAGLGWAAIFAHAQRMSNRAKDALSELPVVHVITPRDWNDSSGLVTFTVPGMLGTEVSARLWDDFKIVQRRVEVPSGVRVSCAYFTNEYDISRLVDAVARISRGG